MKLGVRLEVWQNGPIELEEITIPVKGLHPDLDGFRMATLSDMHMTDVFPRTVELLSVLVNAKPDIICILGDIVDTRTVAVQPLIPLFEALTHTAPTVAVMGNNDYRSKHCDALREAYAMTGVSLLEDEARIFRRGQGALRLLGVQDPMGVVYGRCEARQPEQPNTMPLGEMIQEDMPSVLLLHQTQEAVAYRKQGFALAMGGHAHGGQFRFPWLGPVYAPGQGFWPKYTSGLYDLEGMPLVVSRGLGNHGIPIRLWNRPHVPLAVLRAQG